MSPVPQAGVYPAPELIDDPYPFFAQARAESPVLRDEATGTYLVFGYDELAQVLRDPVTFSSVSPDPTDRGPLSYAGAPMIGDTDPPEHIAHRALAASQLTLRRLREYEELIGGLAGGLAEAIAGRDEVEFVAEFAIELPALVICRLLGLATEGDDYEFVRRFSTMTAEEVEHGREIASQWPAGLARLHSYVRDEVDARRAEPRDDMLTRLVERQIERDGAFDLGGIVTTAAELLLGGVITTGQMIASTMLLLLRHPDELAAVRAERSLLAPLLEESLRVESPVQSRQRFATRPVELGGVEIPAGADLLVVFASGNRDEQAFHRPDRFDLRRTRKELSRHLAFGLGPHVCVGAPLARLEGKLAFERLLDRFGTIRLVEGRNDFQVLRSTHFRSVRRLWVHLADE